MSDLDPDDGPFAVFCTHTKRIVGAGDTLAPMTLTEAENLMEWLVTQNCPGPHEIIPVTVEVGT